MWTLTVAFEMARLSATIFVASQLTDVLLLERQSQERHWIRLEKVWARSVSPSGVAATEWGVRHAGGRQFGDACEMTCSPAMARSINSTKVLALALLSMSPFTPTPSSVMVASCSEPC